jgi:dTDP-N-acetylfucosamine:lipid II N-acetylfucosaminyltransferase
MTLHILILDKFTEPFYHYITEVIKLKHHQFLFISDTQTVLEPNENLHWIKRPLGKYAYCNIKMFVRLCSGADRIIMHGDTLVHFFAAFPFFLRKTGWVIYGQELYSLRNKENFHQKLKRVVLGKVQYHITHIKGDSELANQLLGSKAQFVYSPMYLSNVADTSDFKPTDVSQKAKLKIMVGNSTDPTNGHEAIFRKLEKYSDDIESVFCPLSYGMYDAYKEHVIQLGTEIFGEKFVVMDTFMPFEEYKKFLGNIDIVIFNHNRQEAMGVTLTLLSLGKIVYLNPNTTSYESLTRRGFRIFDNNLIEEQGLKVNRDVSENVRCLKEYYSKTVFDESWQNISNLS